MPPPITVSIKADHLEGTRPDGAPLSLRLNFDLSGNDALALEGTGKAVGSPGAHLDWSLKGSLDGDVVTLTGVVTDANNPVLVGMPESGEANAATGTVTWSWTNTTGPFAGKSGSAQGDAKVDVTKN